MARYLVASLLLLTACGTAEAPPAAPDEIEAPNPAFDIPGYSTPLDGEGHTGADAVGLAFTGLWQSEDDRLAVLYISSEVGGFTGQFGYDGTLDTPPYTLEFVADCETREPAIADSGYFTLSGGDETFCYAVDTLNEDRLVTIYLPRGLTTPYTRANALTRDLFGVE